MAASSENFCERSLIPAYVDGELEADAQARFSEHLNHCLSCRDELRFHQQFMCELDAALIEDKEVLMPADFSRMVAARAVSDMSGVRSATEKRRALAFCLILAGAGFALIGATTRQLTFTVIRRLAAKVLGVLEFAWSTLYTTAASIAVVSRVVSRKLVVETGNLGLVLVLLAFAVLLLSRLIANYHRTGAVE
jgi:anti-sigma factor RsiW